jgi:hypothetical protein
MVNHKLYYPSTLPQDLTIGSQFYVSETKDINLSEPTSKIAFTTSHLTLILSQTKVQSDFDLPTYVNSQSTNIPATKTILTTSRDQSGYLKINDPSSNSTIAIRSLFFITPDNILVSLVSPNSEITTNNLIETAQSLR